MDDFAKHFGKWFVSSLSSFYSVVTRCGLVPHPSDTHGMNIDTLYP